MFFVPEYNTHWYRALALAALSKKPVQPDGEKTSPAMAAGMMRVAGSEWAMYVDQADPKDHWLELAKKHRDDALKQADEMRSRLPKELPLSNHIGPYRVR